LKKRKSGEELGKKWGIRPLRLGGGGVLEERDNQQIIFKSQEKLGNEENLS